MCKTNPKEIKGILYETMSSVGNQRILQEIPGSVLWKWNPKDSAGNPSKSSVKKEIPGDMQEILGILLWLWNPKDSVALHKRRKP